MTGFIVSVFPSRNRVSSQEAFEGLELGEGKPSRPVLRGPGGRKAAWLLGRNNCREQGICANYPILNEARSDLLDSYWFSSIRNRFSCQRLCATVAGRALKPEASPDQSKQ